MSRRPPNRARLAKYRLDSRRFWVACDDKNAPRQYFDFFKLDRVEVVVVPTEDGTSTASAVLDRLEKCPVESGDERWMLLDTDHFVKPGHIGTLLPVLKEARDKGIHVAMSNPCFELWLLFHHTEGPRADKCEDVIAELRRILGSYNKNKLKEEHWPWPALSRAIDRARTIDMALPYRVVPESNTTRVYQLWDSIISKAAPWQLPPELRFTP